MFDHQPIIIESPVHGTWCMPTTPTKQIPSHGTNRMGLRYACDFLMLDNQSKAYHTSFLKYLFIGTPLHEFYCYGQNIYAPLDCEIVEVIDTIKERKRVYWLKEIVLALKNSLFFNEFKHDYSTIAGNYIVTKSSKNIYMVFVHLQTNSVQVKVGDHIKKGDVLGRVGHSGNSTSPHLHFQVVDNKNISSSNSIPLFLIIMKSILTMNGKQFIIPFHHI